MRMKLFWPSRGCFVESEEGTHVLTSILAALEEQLQALDRVAAGPSKHARDICLAAANLSHVISLVRTARLSFEFGNFDSSEHGHEGHRD